MKYRYKLCVIIAVLFGFAAAQEMEFPIFSIGAPKSPVAMSLAGAGTAMVLDGFQGLINPALAVVGPPSGGTLTAGYMRDREWGRHVLPLGAVVNESGGAMGFYYRYINFGRRGDAHDAVINLSGRMAEKTDKQGPVEFGLNIRYEQSKWRHDFEVLDIEDENYDENAPQSAKLRGKNVLLDIGFYQPHILPGFDFAVVVTNLFGYRWNSVDETDEKTSGSIGGQYRTVTIAALYSIPIWNAILLRIPLDVEMANLFQKSVPSKYIVRTGLEAHISQMYSARFGYAHAPGDPMDLIKDFNYKNLFFGGLGINVKPVQLDFFIGREEFGVSTTYFY